MIENDIITILEADAILDGYLSVGASDTKFYPVLAPEDAVAPYIVFKSNVGTLDEILDEDRLQLTINGGTDAGLTQNIRDRIKTLLDTQDELQNNFTSATYYGYYSKLTASDTLFLKDTLEYIEILFFNIKFVKKI